ncbi:collagen alpha-1(XXIII) chain-like, partial [Osmerus eperlanus]|uniref:collagen alpha-1(XXIII) chain-like n=1 Tax=Osmerus eperlanus TaxID=29151 RepID=UPI002E14AC97
MDSMVDSSGLSKAESRCAPRSRFPRCPVGFTSAVCLVLSLSSVSVCLMMSLKTHQLENRLSALETEKTSVFHPPESAFLREDGTVIPALRDSVEMLLQERLNEIIPKLRSARDVAQECSCPP